MSFWNFQSNTSVKKKVHPCISKSVKLGTKAVISGKVFIDENVVIGTSKILSADGDHITVGKDTTIKDNVLISTTGGNFNGTTLKKVRDILVGSKVFISSDVSIFGPSLISNGVFIGNNSTIINSQIGTNCVIEDHVVIKNVLIPDDTFISSKSVIDSNERLNELKISIKNNFSTLPLFGNSTA